MTGKKKSDRGEEQGRFAYDGLERVLHAGPQERDGAGKIMYKVKLSRFR